MARSGGECDDAARCTREIERNLCGEWRGNPNACVRCSRGLLTCRQGVERENFIVIAKSKRKRRSFMQTTHEFYKLNIN